MDKKLVNPNLPILKTYIGSLVFNLQSHGDLIQDLMADHLEIIQRVDKELSLCNAGDGFAVKAAS